MTSIVGLIFRQARDLTAIDQVALCQRAICPVISDPVATSLFIAMRRSLSSLVLAGRPASMTTMPETSAVVDGAACVARKQERP